jgi:hypothetical protein
MTDKLRAKLKPKMGIHYMFQKGRTTGTGKGIEAKKIN